MQKLMRNKGKKFEWNDEAQVAFENIKRELCEAPVLGMPTEKGMYVLDTDASVVAISGILHQEQEWNGRTVLRPIAYGSKVLSDTEMKYGAPKAEMFAVVTFVEKYRAYLGSAPFKLRVDNRALSWLKTYSMDQSYIGRWIVRLDGYHMIIEHRMRDKHQNADSLSKKTEFYERLEQKQANQAEVKEGLSFLDKETYEALPLTRWLDKSGHLIPGHPELPVEKAVEIKILSREDPVPLDLLLRSNLVQQELSRMNINSLSLLDKTVQVTPQVMRMLGGLLEREVTRDNPEWTAAVTSLTVSEKVKIMPSRRQHEENERDCRTIVQQLVSSIPQEILTSTSYGQKGQESGKQKKTVTFVDRDKEGEVVKQNLLQDYLSGEKDKEKNQRSQDQHPGQVNWSGESEIDEKIPDEKQDLENKVLSGEFRWMRRKYRHDLEERAVSSTTPSTDDESRNSGMDTYSDRNSTSGSELSELAIHTLLVETRARDLDREVYQDPDSDRYLIPSERVFDNAADDLETIAVSKRSISLLPQKEVVRTDLQPFQQETQPLAKIWCVKMEEDTHQPNELNSQMRVMKTYLKARYRLSDLLRAQRNDRMTSNLKRWIENGAPDTGDLEEDSYRILRQYFMQKEGRLYLNKDGIVACRRREEDKVLYKYNAIVLTQLYRTELLFRSHDQMGHQGIDKVYQRILKRFEWPGMKKACEKWVTACLSCQQVKDPRKLRFPLQSIESSEFNEVVQIDHQKICMTDSGYNQVLVMIDHFTKYAEAVPCITASAEETCDHLINTWIARHGCPMTFQSDNGTAFVGELTKELMRRQHEENERDCRTKFQQLVSSIPQEILTSTSYGQKGQESGKPKKTVTFVDRNKEGEVVKQNLLQDYLSGEKDKEKNQRSQDQHPGQVNWSGESEIDEKIPDEKQDLENKVLSGEFRWMRRKYRHDLDERAVSSTTPSTDDESRNSGMDTYSDRNSTSGSELSELAIHTLLVETRARDLDREVYQDPDSDRYLIPSERVFDNAANDLETIAVSKRSISLLPQKEVVRTDLQPFQQETQPLAKIWCVKMEEDTHQPNELNSQMRVMKTYLKARYRLSDLLRAQRNDRMTSNLKRWIENGAPDTGDLEEDSYRILRQYFMQKEGRLYLNKDGIVACRRREEDKVLYKYNAIVLPQLYQTELLFRSHDQMGHQGIDKVYQRILKRFEWPGMKKACEKWVTACLSCQQVKDPRKLRFPLQSIESSEFNEVV